MEYCSLQDAFPEIGGGPASPGCKGAKAGEIARKEERKKAKRCKGPPLTFLEPPGDGPLVDPDRPALRPLPEVPPLNTATGLRQHAPVDAPQMDPFTDMNDSARTASDIMASYRSEQPPADEKVLNTLPRGLAGPNAMQKAKMPKYFGANYDESVEEGFASFTNVIGDDPGYRLSPDFTSAFAGEGVNKASGQEVLPIPSVKNVWKPLTPGGARTAFFDSLPVPGGTFGRDDDEGQTAIVKQAPPYDKEEFFRKLDSIYARLDDLETRRGENTQTEILLFITSGIFVLFSLDLLVRKTGNVRVLNRK